MKAARIILPVAVLALSSQGFAQSRNYAAGVQTYPEHVIIPWTHFGQGPALPDPPASPPPQTETAQPAVLQPGDPRGTAVSGASVPAPNAQPSSSSSTPAVYEADISQKHPHPPEPVDLPIADQGTVPALNVLTNVSGLGSVEGNSEIETGLEAKSPSQPQDHSPEAQIAALTAGYMQRQATRQAQRAQIKAAGAHDPATQAVAQIEVTRLLLEGEKDREATSQQLAQAFSSLGEELDNRAQRVRNLAQSRKQTALTADAELNEINESAPRREMALRNLAMLPASTDNDQIISNLSAELEQEENTRKLDEEQSHEAGSEIKALQNEANTLERAATVARRKSSNFADAAQSARVNENLLADRLEYAVAQMRTADLLAGASKVLDHSGALKENLQIGPLPAAGSVPAPLPSASTAVDQLRDCIRQTGNPDACRAKGEQ
jgi:hypothetical protein